MIMTGLKLYLGYMLGSILVSVVSLVFILAVFAYLSK